MRQVYEIKFVRKLIGSLLSFENISVLISTGALFDQMNKIHSGFVYNMQDVSVGINKIETVE